MKIEEKYLPIGTVVILKNGKKRVMITGFLSLANDSKEKKLYDYSGCIYPEGLLSSTQICLFDHDQIEKIFHMGLSDEEDIEFKKKLVELASNIKNLNYDDKIENKNDLDNNS